MLPFYIDLSLTLVNLAHRTWESLRLCPPNGIDVGEETLTDINLLDIQVQHSAKITLYKYPKLQEHVASGDDWEWFIGNSRSGWRTLRIQAKKLFFKSNRYIYQELNGAQLHLLLSSATNPAVGAVPMYCFYNYWDHNAPTGPGPWLTRRCTCFSPANHPSELQGCALA